jgi:hypothetical protein
VRFVRRLLPSQDVDALLGDIAEEARYRTRLWYLAQIAALLVVGSWKDIRSNKQLAFRAAVVGIAATLLLIELQLALEDVGTGAGFMLGTRWIGLPRYWHYPYWNQSSYRIFVDSISTLCSMTTGWIVVRSHRAHGVTMVVAFLAGLVAFRIMNLAAVPGPMHFTWWRFAQSWSFEATLILLGGCFATKPLEHS